MKVIKTNERILHPLQINVDEENNITYIIVWICVSETKQTFHLIGKNFLLVTKL